SNVRHELNPTESACSGWGTHSGTRVRADQSGPELYQHGPYFLPSLGRRKARIMTQDDDLQKIFARNVRTARKRAGLIQRDVAERLGVRREVIGRYERADLWPSLANLRRLCDVLNVSADFLFGLAPGEGAPVVSTEPSSAETSTTKPREPSSTDPTEDPLPVR